MSSATGLARRFGRVAGRSRNRRPGADGPVSKSQPGLHWKVGGPADTRNVAANMHGRSLLAQQGWRVSSTVGRMLHQLTGCNRSASVEGASQRTAVRVHQRAADAFLADGQPVISSTQRRRRWSGTSRTAGGNGSRRGRRRRCWSMISQATGGQCDSVRCLRHGAQRSLGERGMGP